MAAFQGKIVVNRDPVEAYISLTSLLVFPWLTKPSMLFEQ